MVIKKHQSSRKPSPFNQQKSSRNNHTVADGSFKDERGAAAWWLETKDGKASLSGTSVSPGPPELQSAYRSELIGVLAILETLRILTKDYQITKGHVLLHAMALLP